MKETVNEATSGAVPAWRLVCLGPGAAARLAALHREAFAEPWDETAFATLLAQEGSAALGAAQGIEGHLLGFVLGRAAADEGEILTLAVLPPERRRGLGRALVTALAAFFGHSGVRRLYLEVGLENAPALALYQSLGFEGCGRRNAYYLHGSGRTEDALLMVLPCPPAADPHSISGGVERSSTGAPDRPAG